MEAKLVQQLTFIEQCLLCGIFIDLTKVVDAMNHGGCLDILRNYGVEECVLYLTIWFWKQAVIVCKASGYYGRPFKACHGVN